MLQKISKLSFAPVLFENVIMPAYDFINLNSTLIIYEKIDNFKFNWKGRYDKIKYDYIPF